MRNGLPVRKPTEEDARRMGRVEFANLQRRWMLSQGLARPVTPVDRALLTPEYWVDQKVREEEVIPIPPPPMITADPFVREPVEPSPGAVEILENLASLEGWRTVMIRKSGKRMIGMLLIQEGECPDSFVDQFEVATKQIEGAELAHLKLL